MPHSVPSRILFIDAYDSFSNNIISLLETRLADVHVVSIKIDELIPDFPAFLKGFDAVVAGPGPGHPDNPMDVGLMSQLWQLSDDEMIPVLGICLGFQSLVTAFGGSVVPLPDPRHGIVRKVTFKNVSIFKGITTAAPVQYHSLHALLTPDEDFAADPRGGCQVLEPLAWDTGASDISLKEIPAWKVNPEVILMAVRHTTKPFYGVQFHPESICSDDHSQQLIDNWWSAAQSWSQQRKTQKAARAVHTTTSRDLKLVSLPEGLETLRDVSLQRELHDETASESESKNDLSSSSCASSERIARVVSKILPLNGLTVPQICELLHIWDGGEAVVLDSEPHQRSDVGTHSIMGKFSSDMLRIEYYVGSNKVNLIQDRRTTHVQLADYGNDVFGYLKAFMNDRKATGGDPNIPFWGGLVGNISYEACLETVGVQTPSFEYKPDISLRSLNEA